MIPANVRQGATKLERWLLNQGKFKKAMIARNYRGIANLHEATDPKLVVPWQEAYRKMVVRLVGTDMSIIDDHILDDSDYDRDWNELEDWMENKIDYQEYLRKQMAERDKWLNSLTVSMIHGMGYMSDAILFTKNVMGRIPGWHDTEEEWWRFPDGDEYHDHDGRGYAVKLGIINKL